VKTILNPFEALHARRLIVALAITGAAAALASPGVLSEPSLRSDVLTVSAAAELLLAGGKAVEDYRSTAPGSPKGCSRRLAPIAQTSFAVRTRSAR